MFKGTKRNCAVRLALVLVIACLSEGAMAQVSGYLADQRGAPVRSGAGLCWRTGYWTPAMATQECDPELLPKKAAPAAAVTPAPRTAPPAPAATPKPVSKKMTLSAETLFDFDKAVLRPEGKSKLGELVASLKPVDIEVVIVTGHTDRIGSDSYNLKLSQRRAESVKAYLASKGVPAERIKAEGKGKAQPITKSGQCKGRKKTTKLIRCLQPDRRVEIEVVGTRGN